MKKLLLSLLVWATLFPVEIMAVTRDITVPLSKEPFTNFLRQQVRGLTAADTAIISFGAGEFFIDGNVDILCNAEIRGAGRNKTKIVILNRKNYTDDCFFGFKPRLPQTTAVWIHDLTMENAPHRGLWWSEQQPRIAIKLYNCHSVTVERTDITLDNAYNNCIDMRVCSNIIVRDCVLKNFNNCHAGAVLSVRGDTRNALVENNKIYKHGNDEAVTFFGYSNDPFKLDIENDKFSFKENIRIVNNDFYAGYYEGKNPTDTVIDTYLTLILSNENKGKTPQTLKGFEVLNNNFYVNTPIHNLLAFTFDEYSSHSGVRVEDNKVVNYESAGSDDFWVSEIIIKDMSPNSDSIYIHNNTFKTECEWETSWHDAGYTHISIDGGKVSYANNKLEAASPSSSSIGRGYNGVTLVAFRKRGGNLTLTDNSFTGIYSLAQLSEHEQVSPSSLRAIGNSFTGDTRIYCGDVSRFDASFSDNVFKSRSATYLLETWAKQGSLQFVRNKVSVARPAGPILTNWSGRDLYDMRFTNLEIYGNQFRNVDQSQLLQNIRLVDKQYVTRNRFN